MDWGLERRSRMRWPTRSSGAKTAEPVQPEPLSPSGVVYEDKLTGGPEDFVTMILFPWQRMGCSREAAKSRRRRDGFTSLRLRVRLRLVRRKPRG